MKLKLLVLTLFTVFANRVFADEITISDFERVPQFTPQTPFFVDSTDVNGKKYENKVNNDVVVKCAFQNRKYANLFFTVDGTDRYEIFVDNQKISTSVSLLPDFHNVELKYRPSSGGNSIKLNIESNENCGLSVENDGSNHRYGLNDVLFAKTVNYLDVSPDGSRALAGFTQPLVSGKSTYSYKLINLDDLSEMPVNTSSCPLWMPKSNRYYYFRTLNNGREMVAVNPDNGKENVLASNLPAGNVFVSPQEDYLIISIETAGPKKDKSVYEVLEPADRRPGWRNRNNLSKYDLNTKQLQPLTFGHRDVALQDISSDGKYILFMVSESRLEKRPTTVCSLYKMNVHTLKADLIVEKDGFINRAVFSPDAKQILVLGSPEAFGGIGKNVGKNKIPSMSDMQIFLLENEGKDVKPLTRQFDPSVSGLIWHRNTNTILFTAEDKDSVNLFAMNPSDWTIRKMSVPEEVVSRFCVANDAPVILHQGNMVSKSDKIYQCTIGDNSLLSNSKLIVDMDEINLAETLIGKCCNWTYKNKRGETIYGRYYLPSDFDENKQYPMIVYYYGGSLPTSRNFESRYPFHVYAEHGYVVLVVNPGGAIGFGQNFSALHVNTAGKGIADDIIVGVKQFCKEHAFVESNHIGCIGASYGGFMTQYLLTQTDIFAAGVSHAGISDHTSYWGNGYWGFDYSEVSMANSYPWSRKDLFVDQSPLYNADKINTPLLFLHGTADTNVPTGESIQMFTAMKLLGKPVSLVLVEGENHHVTDMNKRIRWQNTIFAWFAKWLQNDENWWNAMYPIRDF